MSRMNKVRACFFGIVELILCAVLLFTPDMGYEIIDGVFFDGYRIVIIVLSLTLILAGIRSIIYYFVMAIHMVGGKTILYTGTVLFDLGVFTATMANLPRIYIMLYLLLWYVITGTVDILGALESMRMGASSWKLKLFQGLFNMVIVILGIAFLRSQNTVIYIYALGLVQSGLIRIISAFRRTAIVYIA
ncbi:MAG: hypothetical protein J6O55_08040 [Lachnospiraceae bacterium]|nr:hypothetical protein [Lachnospiraceae bacterium]